VSLPLNLHVLALISAALVTALVLPLWRAWCRRAGIVDDPGHRKIHDRPVPLAGGLAVLTGLLLPLLGVFAITQFGFSGTDTAGKIDDSLSGNIARLAAIFGGATAMTFLGWLDDKLELHPALKFSGQLVIAGLVAATGVRIAMFATIPWLGYSVTVLWVLTVTNAFNFMDNMNGLCAGLGGIAALFIGLSAARQEDHLVAALAFLLLGAALGFLPFNFPRASVFLGDAGSHLFGFLVSVLVLLPGVPAEVRSPASPVLGPVLILAVPLADLVWVVLWRWRTGKPFYIGDTNHLSHRLVRLGLSKVQTVVAIWLLAAGAGCLALLL